jgi:D-alanyl-D-alanine carboxypeptidase (penicillin-binding protein 5/6)
VGGGQLLSRDFVLPAGSAPLPAGLTAQAWVLSDLDTGQILGARDAHGRYQPASILKALTSLVLLPRLSNGAQVITASAAAANAEGSAVGLVPGGQYTVDTLFESLLLMSGNDAATALSEAAGGDAAIVAAMNAEAVRLGAYDTFVQTPSGLDGWQQLTSAYDLSLILRAAAANPRFVAYDQALTATLPPQQVGARAWGAVPLFNQSENFLTGVPGAFIAKTGFTDAALHTYMCAAQRGGRRLGLVFLRAQRLPTDQWQQAASLLDWGFALPTSTKPVGQLIAPASGDGTTTPTPTPSPTSTPTPTPTPSPSRTASPSPSERPAPGAAVKTTGAGLSMWTIVNVGALALLAAVVGLKLRRRTVRNRMAKRG